MNNWNYIKLYCERHNVRDGVMKWIKEAYDNNYDEKSDGISFVSDLDFERFDSPALRKHPAGVMHDFLYAFAPVSRKQADKLFQWALEDFGRPIIAKIRYFGLRIGGWLAWNKCRREQLERSNKKVSSAYYH